MIFVQAAADASQALDEVRWVLSLDWPELSGIVADARLDGEGLPNLLRAYEDFAEIVGVRHILRGEHRAIDSTAMADGLAAVAHQGLAFDATVRADQLVDLAHLHARVPEARVVLDHLGDPPIALGFASAQAREWLEGIRALAEQDKVLTKLSAVPWNESARPFIEAALCSFGSARVMLGSDFPITPRSESSWERAADLLALSWEEREDLRWRTASRTYRIDPHHEESRRTTHGDVEGVDGPSACR